MSSETILFIPFCQKENSFSLYMRALDWRYNLRGANKLKVPDIVIYRRSDEEDKDYEGYEGAQFKFSAEHFSTNTTIYILADGMGDPHYVINVNQTYYERLNEHPYRLSIEAVAWRMKQSGLTPELTEKVNAIKLFVCEESETNQQLTVNFANALGEQYSGVNLCYYKAILYAPSFNEQDTIKKEAKKRAAIFSSPTNGHRQLIDAGFASMHKHSLKVGDVLKIESTSNSYLSSQFLEDANAEALPTFRETLVSEKLKIEEIDEEIESVIYSPITIELPSEDELDSFSSQTDSENSDELYDSLYNETSSQITSIASLLNTNLGFFSDNSDDEKPKYDNNDPKPPDFR